MLHFVRLIYAKNWRHTVIKEFSLCMKWEEAEVMTLETDRRRGCILLAFMLQGVISTLIKTKFTLDNSLLVGSSTQHRQCSHIVIEVTMVLVRLVEKLS